MAGSAGNKAISAFNLVEVEVEAELSKKFPPFLYMNMDRQPAGPCF